MVEHGTIVRQVDGDIYECMMEDQRIYLIEIMGYAGGEIDIPFTLHRNHPEHGEAIYIEDIGYLGVVVQSEL
jgi:hypothetical protein